MIELRRYYFRHTKAHRIIRVMRVPSPIIRRALARAREARTKKKAGAKWL